MKLEEVLFEKQEQKGTYAAVKFSKNTTKAIKDYIDENKIPTAVRSDRLHTTLLYSRTYCPDYTAQGKITPAWVGHPLEFEVWKTNGDGDKPQSNCLVLRYECKELEARHKLLMKEHNASYDFPDYKPHITFSYDIGDLDPDSLPDVTKFLGNIEIVEEYGEDLDLDWGKTKGVETEKRKKDRDE